jgi:hypothetical protein
MIICLLHSKFIFSWNISTDNSPSKKSARMIENLDLGQGDDGYVAILAFCGNLFMIFSHEQGKEDIGLEQSHKESGVDDKSM